MRAIVVTIMDMPQSVQAARRCIESGKTFGLEIEMFAATTPADDPMKLFAAYGWPTARFTNNRYSRALPCMSCFLSHARAWRECVDSGKPLCIAEHDCVMVRPLPDVFSFDLLTNLCRPSFGTWKQPPCGISPLTSKPFMPGATFYHLHPKGAERLLAKAGECEPTDVYMSLKRFPFIRELFPYVAECHDWFSSVQDEAGCVGKHRTVTIL